MERNELLKNLSYNFNVIDFVMKDIYENGELLNNKDYSISSYAKNCHPSYYIIFNITKNGKTIENKIRFSDHSQTSGFYHNEKQANAYSLDVLAGSKNEFVKEKSFLYKSNRSVFLESDVSLKNVLEKFLYKSFYEAELLDSDLFEYVCFVLKDLEFK